MSDSQHDESCGHDYRIAGTEPCGGCVVLKCSLCGGIVLQPRYTVSVTFAPPFSWRERIIRES
jgi:hypothetical protein